MGESLPNAQAQGDGRMSCLHTSPVRLQAQDDPWRQDVGREADYDGARGSASYRNPFVRRAGRAAAGRDQEARYFPIQAAGSSAANDGPYALSRFVDSR